MSAAGARAADPAARTRPRQQHRPGSPARHPEPAPEPGAQPPQCHNAPV